MTPSTDTNSNATTLLMETSLVRSCASPASVSAIFGAYSSSRPVYHGALVLEQHFHPPVRGVFAGPDSTLLRSRRALLQPAPQRLGVPAWPDGWALTPSRLP